MNERDRSYELDDLVDAVLSGNGDAGGWDPELVALGRVAGELHNLPSDQFRARLRNRLQRSTTMTTVHYIPQGLETVTPYLIVRDAAAAIDFYESVFGASQEQRYADEHGRVYHAKLRIGTSMVEMGEHADVDLQDPGRMPQIGMHLYVEDVDALVARAEARGVRIVRPVEEQPYGDREASIADPFGIIWFVATHVRDG